MAEPLYIPKHWQRRRLGEIVEINPRIPKDIDDLTEVSFVPMRLIEEETGRLSAEEHKTVGELRRRYTYFAEGDVLFAKVTPSMENGKAAVASGLRSGIGFGSSELYVLRPRPGLDPFFLFYFITRSSFREAAARSMTGAVGLQRVPRKFLLDQTIAVPPLDEQMRLVAEIDKQLTRLNTARASLARVGRKVRQFRSASLNAAWHGVGSRNTAVRNTSRAVRPMVTLAEVCESIADGDHLPPPQAKEGIPFLTIGNISGGKLNFAGTRHVPKVYFDGLKPQRVPNRGDILYTVVGATIGIPVIVDADRAFCFQRHIALLKPSPQVNTRYLWAMMSSPAFLDTAWKRTTGSAQPTLPIRALRQLQLPLPPLEEQAHIAEHLDSCLLAAAKVARTVETSVRRTGALREALLQNAFSGRLIATATIPRTHVTRPVTIRARRSPREQISSISRTSASGNKDPMHIDLAQFNQQPSKRLTPHLLFTKSGAQRDDAIPFFDAIADTPHIIERLDRGVNAKAKRRRSSVLPKKRATAKGRFRLHELWIKGFRNLQDYHVTFNPGHSLDVLLGWNGTGKSNLFEALVIIFRDLSAWTHRDKWAPERDLSGYRIRYEVDEHIVEASWDGMDQRPKVVAGKIRRGKPPTALSEVERSDVRLPHFVFGYYSGPSSRFSDLFNEPKQEHYYRLLKTRTDNREAIARLLQERRFFCAETHHAKYALLAFFYQTEAGILEFLRTHLRIVELESVLFILKRPRWHRNNDPEDFWGADGLLRPFLERLRNFSTAPMVLPFRANEGYEDTNRDHYFLLLPNKERLQDFASHYGDAASFFVALESADFSSIIRDVRIRIRVQATANTQVTITFGDMSEGEQQLLMVLGLLRFTQRDQSLILLDEPDTHLNPHWQLGYLRLLLSALDVGTKRKMTAEQKSIEPLEAQLRSQLLLSTHDPLAIASLTKENIHLLKRDKSDGICYAENSTEDPRGMGFTGILTSDMFGLRSDLDEETLKLLDEHAELAGRNSLSVAEKRNLDRLTTEMERLGFATASSDPYYGAFLKALQSRRSTQRLIREGAATSQEREKLARETRDLIESLEGDISE